MLDILHSNFRDSDFIFNSNFKNLYINLSQNFFSLNNKDYSEKSLDLKNDDKLKKSSKSLNLEIKRSDEYLNLNLKENSFEEKNLKENNFYEQNNLHETNLKENNLKKNNNFDKFNEENYILSDRYWSRMREINKIER